MKKIMMMALAAGFGLTGSAMASGNDALQQKVDSLEKELAELKVRMQDRNADLLDELVAREGLSQSADTGLTAGYDKHFFIKSADDEFRLNFGARLQFRHTYAQMDSAGTSNVDASRFELERTRLMFSGKAMKNLSFLVQLDVDDDGNSTAGGADTGHNADLYNAWVAYAFSPDFGVRIGCNDLQFGKQRPTSSGKFMGVERLMPVQVFDLGRSTGIEAFGSMPVGDVKVAYTAGVFNSLADNDVVTDGNNDNNPVLVARVMVPLMGSVKDFSNESDLAYHNNPVMMIGASYAYANNMADGGNAGTDSYSVLATRQDGTWSTLSGQGKVSMLGADVSYKCKGFSATVEGFYQRANFDDTTIDAANSAALTDGLAEYTGAAYDTLGWYAQAGQFLVPEKFELFARVGGVDIDCNDDMYEYTGGWNYYINGQDLKLSMDVTYIDEVVNDSSTANYNMGELGESLFMVRSQLQFQF